MADKLLNIRFIPTGDQVADGFTKPLTLRQLEASRHNLNLESCDLRGVLNNVIYGIV